jgi:hypothetical protein
MKCLTERLSYFAAQFFLPSRVLLPSLNLREEEHETDCSGFCHCGPGFVREAGFSGWSNDWRRQLCWRSMFKGSLSTEDLLKKWNVHRH